MYVTYSSLELRELYTRTRIFLLPLDSRVPYVLYSSVSPSSGSFPKAIRRSFPINLVVRRTVGGNWWAMRSPDAYVRATKSSCRMFWYRKLALPCICCRIFPAKAVVRKVHSLASATVSCRGRGGTSSGVARLSSSDEDRCCCCASLSLGISRASESMRILRTPMEILVMELSSVKIVRTERPEFLGTIAATFS